MFLTSTGGFNTALGERSMYNNTTGVNNTAVGQNSIQNNITGNNNTAIGKDAGPTTDALTNTTCIGYNATASASNSVILGNGANVGIGTASPGYPLDVTGDMHCSGAFYCGNNSGATAAGSIGGRMYFGGTYGDQNYTDGGQILSRLYATTESSELVIFKGNDANASVSLADRIRLRAGAICFDTYTGASSDPTAESIRMVIDQSGNVGIGITNPGAVLTVVGGSAIPVVQIHDSSSGGPDYGATYGMVNLTRAADTVKAHVAFIRAGNFVWQMGYIQNTNAIGMFPYNFSGTQGTPTMTWSGGNVGIGTASPPGKLTVAVSGDAENMSVGAWSARYFCVGQSPTSTSSCVSIGFNNSTNAGWIYSLAPNIAWRNLNYGAANHYFYCASITATLSMVGANVGIGTVSPSYPLHVEGSPNTVFRTTRYFNVNNGTIVYTGGANFSVGIFSLYDIATNASFSAFSDRRAKVLEQPPTEPYLSLVDKIQFHQYSWIDKIEKGSSKKIGFFAQEVEEVVPGAVGQTTAVVPTIYREADAFTDTTLTVTGHGLTTEKKLQIVDLENGKTKIDIVRVIDADNLEVKFEKVPKDKLFVVGPEVDDSRMVNHDYLMAVGFGGLKELHALVKTQQTTIEMLTERLALLESKLTA